MAEEKQFKPTKKRLREARKKGQVLKSDLFSQSFQVLGLIIGLFISAKYIFLRSEKLLKYFSEGNITFEVIITEATKVFLLTISAPLMLAGIFGLLVTALQVGLYFEPEIIKLDFSKINPVQGLKKLLSGWKEALITLLRLLLFATVIYFLVSEVIKDLPNATLSAEGSIVAIFRHWSIKYAMAGIISLFIVGGVDYFIKRKKFYKDLSMSAEDMKEEHKQQEGDPMVKSQRKALHRQMLSQQMVKQIRKAKVVVVEKNED